MKMRTLLFVVSAVAVAATPMIARAMGGSGGAMGMGGGGMSGMNMGGDSNGSPGATSA